MKIDRPCYKNAWWTFAKKILYRELQVGKRFNGGQKKRYKHTLKASVKDQQSRWNRLHRIEQSGEAS